MSSLFSHYNLIKESGLFDEAYYRRTNPEVQERNLDPLVHYLEIGARKLRNPSEKFDAGEYVSRLRERDEHVDNPLLHFLQSSAKRGMKSVESDALPERALPRAELLLSMDRVELKVLHGAHRLSGFGWCLAESPVTELRVELGTKVASARYGIHRADVARIYPEVVKSDVSGFEFDLELSADEQIGAIELRFIAQTAKGPRSQLVPIIVDALQTNGGDTESNVVPRYMRPPMKLELEAAFVDPTGMLRILGWVVCLVPIDSVDVLIGGERLAAAECGRPRQDVAAMHPDYPNAGRSGFFLIADLSAFSEGDHTITVRAKSATGISRQAIVSLKFPSQRANPEDNSPETVECFCDQLEVFTSGRIEIAGWAVGPSATESIAIFLDDVAIGEASISRARPDVGNRFPVLPHARESGFGFRYVGPAVSNGEHLLLVRHRSRGIDTDVLLPVLAVEDPVSRKHNPETRVSQSANVLLNIDKPQISEASITFSLRGDLEVIGWALGEGGVASVDVALDGETIKSVETCVHRRDVQRAFPNWEGAATAGFYAMLPARTLQLGRHKVSVIAKTRRGDSITKEFFVEVEEISDASGPWALRRRMSPAEVTFRKAALVCAPRPRFAVIILTAGDSLGDVQTTVRSLSEQTYDDWTVWVVSTPLADKSVELLSLADFSDVAHRINLVQKKRDAWIDAFDKSADYILVLQPGDQIGCDALLEYAVQAALRPGADFLYSDERRLSPTTNQLEAFFKPQWSPDLLLSMNYIGRAWCARTEIFDRDWLLSENLSAHSDYDIVLRLTERAKEIVHVALTLHESRGARDGSDQRAVLRAALERRNIKATVSRSDYKGIHRIRREHKKRHLVSIVIPTCAARGLVKVCIESLRNVTAYRQFEVICIENIPESQPEWKAFIRAHSDHVISTDEVFNWSRFNNLAVERAKGSYLLFLNDDVEIIHPKWLETLVEQAQREEIGAVGPLLLYPDRRVQHAGMFWAHLAVARHAFRYSEQTDPGYFGLAKAQREVIAVTGACLMTRRTIFDALGGFDESHSVVLNDVDYCLRVREHGLRTIYTPHTTLIHHELASRGEIGDDYDAMSFEAKWKRAFLAGDPYFHNRLSRERDDFAVEWEPTVVGCAGNPVFELKAIRRILILKLDHIGDCITALPAIRRVKELFPGASVCVLSGPASRSVWRMEPAVDEVLEFDFFHARSSKGLVSKTENDLTVLAERLRPCKFDLAIDLRKHWETRPVLQLTGARYLAGFDTKGKFPWLDIALEWAEDSALLRKRQHAADDLINLVEAVAAAGAPRREVIAVSTLGGGPDELTCRLPGSVDPVFQKRVICVHAGAGNETKQWPQEYFVTLIDRLIETEGVNVILVGGPDETDLGQRIRSASQYSDSIWSLIGALDLTELPLVISRCALFVGNDSGPKHIAAALGIPTIGLQSGVVDVREWGPKGVNAVAIYREMACSPCYRSKVEECHRGLACLRGLLPRDVIPVCERMLKAGERVSRRSDISG